ncbi:MAG: hypothetical protein AAFX40_04900 [Cyanobacteria bacterium J06639_1]
MTFPPLVEFPPAADFYRGDGISPNLGEWMRYALRAGIASSRGSRLHVTAIRNRAMDLQNYLIYILGGAGAMSLATLVYVLIDENKKKKQYDAELEEWERNEPLRREMAAKAKAEAEAKAEEEAARAAAEAQPENAAEAAES